MKAVISVPQQVVTGIFNINVALWSRMAFGTENLVIRSVSGEALRCEFKVLGSGKDYMVICYVHDGCCGEAEVSLAGGLEARPVRVKFDSYRSVVASFGEVRYDNNKAIVPVRFDHDVVGLTKRHFRVEMGRGRYSVYGKGRDYEVHVVTDHPFSVDIVRQVCKASGVLVDVDVVKRWL